MQVEMSAERSVQKRQTTGLYLMTWVAIAAFGVGYLGIATTRPDLIGAMLPLADAPPEQAAARQVNDLSEEIIALRKWVHELQHDLAATRSTLQDQVTNNTALLQRLVAAEDRLATLQEAKETAPKTPAAKAQTRAQAPATAPAPTDPKVAQAPSHESGAGASSGVKVINPTVSQLATGSLPEKSQAAPPAAPPATPVAKAPPSTPRSIEIGSSESLDGLRSQWNEIAGRGSDVLGAASPRYRLFPDGRAQPFTLLAGPFETPADATRACNALRAKGIACRLGGSFSGNAL